MERKELTVELPCRSSGQARTENRNTESMNYRIDQMAAEAWGKGKEDRIKNSLRPIFISFSLGIMGS